MRHVFFSFHYQRDVWRASIVRNSNLIIGEAPAGFRDASIWEEAKKKGDRAIKNMIDQALVGTTVTAVLIGAETASRTYVNYEIDKSIERGNGLIGVRIHNIKNQWQQTDYPGPVPQRLLEGKYPIYTWLNSEKFAEWAETAYLVAQAKKTMRDRYKRLF